MWNLSKFSERLLELMDEKELNAPMFAEIVHVDRTNVTRYLNGHRSPRYEVFLEMLRYFKCSADFLIGLSDDDKPGDHYKEPAPFASQLRKVLKEAGISQYRLEKELEVSGSVVFKWLNSISLPSIGSLARLSEYIGFSVDYILGRT